ncbi:hypothetical protein GCM10010329_66160 [Streptomyces spiroverticillatus]|uniref:Secreted protein n=1 Tax=Streptomyces finlayi TaxID=67296 RepID=A0A919CDI5_9ACTN|nr:hypothetical protein [Streptomyces finlayi]GHA33883.1 hypothetical protein GCM10010329_66160 [Streptomyces spiroverticillatus]GHD11528.1 hypothetical protein GCM10010334_67710 [Streptomyces finlayi]
MRLRLPACAAALALLTACSGSDSGANHRSDPAPCPVQTGSPSSDEAERLAAALEPLVERGGTYEKVYGAMVVDHPERGRLALCLSDPAGFPEISAAVKKRDPKADTSRLDLYVSRYSRTDLEARVDKLVDTAMGKRKKVDYGFPVRESSALEDASGISVGTTREGAASREFRERLEKATGVPVSVEYAPQAQLD